MPLRLSAGDRKPLLIGGAVLAAIILALAFVAPTGEGDERGRPSSYSAALRGGKGAFLLLKRSGYHIERFQKAPAGLPNNPAGTVLIIPEPRRYPDAADAAALRHFLAGGGTILIAGWVPDRFAPGLHLTSAYPTVREGWAECRPAAPTRLSRGGPISMDGFAAWSRSERAPLVHYEHEGHPVVVTYRIGRGEVIWWASALPLTNAALRDRSNLDLLANSLGDARLVLWDEYFQEAGRGAWSLAWGPALKWAAVHACLFAALVLFSFARRSGPLVPRPVVSRLSPLEFVDTLGGLYQRARAAQAAVEIAYTRFRQVAARRLALGPRLGAGEAGRALRHRVPGAGPDLAARLQSCEQAIGDPGLTDGAALDHVRFLSDAMRAIEKPPEVRSPKSRVPS